MKKLNHILVWILTLGLLMGCNDFLDVNPDGKVTQDKMFEDVQGYRDAMYGIYASIAKEALYGQNLSYGFADQLGQLFYNPYEREQGVQKILQFQYKDQNVFPTVETVWEKAYESISYINNVLENIRNVDMNADPDYHLIKGEALALRGFLHFDIMRYYCEHIQTNPNAGGIPYAYTYDLKNKELFTLKECYKNVLKDLTEAQHLLANDTILRGGAIGSVYTGSRYSHVNLYATYAMKARVFHYEGNLDSAGFYAQKVIAASSLKLNELPSTLANEKKYPCSNELIWGLFNNKLYNTLFSIFLSDGRTTFTQVKPRQDVKKIYQDVSWSATNHDYRYDQYIGTNSDGLLFIRLLNVNEKDPEDVEKQKKETTGICMLRLPEMYYIAAEALYNKDRTLALQYFNDVRKSRGLNIAMDEDRVDTFDKFLNELTNERRKEFWGEGQTFLEYKRRNVEFDDITSKEKIQPSTAVFKLPWPKNEEEFGSTNQ